MSGTFKEKAVGELLTVLPSDRREIESFGAGVARAAGSVHLTKPHTKNVLNRSSNRESIPHVDFVKKK